MEAITAAAKEILQEYSAAVWEKDVERFLCLYGTDVRVFDAWESWAYDGVRSWRSAVEAWFSSLGTRRVRVSFEDVMILGEAPAVSVSAIVTYAGVSSDGATIESMQNRLTWFLQSRGALLRIVHEHTSAPIAIEGAKAILKRTSAT